MFLIFEIIFRNNKTGKKYMIVNQIHKIKFPAKSTIFRELVDSRNFLPAKFCDNKVFAISKLTITEHLLFRSLSTISSPDTLSENKDKNFLISIQHLLQTDMRTASSRYLLIQMF